MGARAKEKAATSRGGLEDSPDGRAHCPSELGKLRVQHVGYAFRVSSASNRAAGRQLGLVWERVCGSSKF